MALADDLERAAREAATQADGDRVSGVLPTEAAAGRRVYVCAFEGSDGERSWLALDGEGHALDDRRDVRDAVSIAALCEVAEEAAFPGDLDELRAQLVALRITEAPDGIEEAEAAARDGAAAGRDRPGRAPPRDGPRSDGVLALQRRHA